MEREMTWPKPLSPIHQIELKGVIEEKREGELMGLEKKIQF